MACCGAHLTSELMGSLCAIGRTLQPVPTPTDWVEDPLYRLPRFGAELDLRVGSVRLHEGARTQPLPI